MLTRLHGSRSSPRPRPLRRARPAQTARPLRKHAADPESAANPEEGHRSAGEDVRVPRVCTAGKDVGSAGGGGN